MISFFNQTFRFRILFLLVVLLITSACTSVSNIQNRSERYLKNLAFPGYEHLSKKEQILADSIIGVALDHEALYSLVGNIKPMSSIGFSMSFPFGKDSLDYDGKRDIVNIDAQEVRVNIEKIKRLNKVLKALSFDRYQFILVPFKNIWESKRNMQILICRKDLIDKILDDNKSFFTQWGFVEGINPAVLVTAIEFESRNDRYRAYGYLFGYPSHAVDFFVDASIYNQKNKQFVKRSFFNIPVFKRKKGHFTYALPENFIPLEKDSMLYKRSVKVLDTYKKIRPKFINKKGDLEAIKLFRYWYQNSTVK